MKISDFRIINVSRDTAREVSRMILKEGSLTRRELAQRAGISVMTAGKIASGCREAGLAEKFSHPSERGRTPVC